jgi:hypothetical protein
MVEGLGLNEGANGLEATGSPTPMSLAAEAVGEPCSVALEALSASSAKALVAPDSESEESGEPEPEEIKQAGESGSSSSFESALNPGQTASIAREGESVALTPNTGNSSESCEPALIHEAAAVESNTEAQVDTVTRPLYDGAVTFQAIRGPGAPEAYSWEVDLGEGQSLRLVDNQHVEVDYEEGTPAMMITAEPAHDATGATVPTTLSISGERVVSLHVPYGTGDSSGTPYVYPILAGEGYEVGHEEVEIIYPPSLGEEEGEEVEVAELEALRDGQATLGISTVGPPENLSPVSKEEAAVMEITEGEKVIKGEKQFRFDICHSHTLAGDPPPVQGPDTHARRSGEEKVLHFHCRDPEYDGNYWRVTIQGKFHYVFHQRVWLNWKQWSCYKTGGDEIDVVLLRHCEAFYPNGAHYPSVARFRGPIEVLGEWRFPTGYGQFAAEAKPNCLTAGGFLFPNPRKGDAEGLYEEPLAYHRPLPVEVAEDCPEITAP